MARNYSLRFFQGHTDGGMSIKICYTASILSSGSINGTVELRNRLTRADLALLDRHLWHIRKEVLLPLCDLVMLHHIITHSCTFLFLEFYIIKVLNLT